MNLLLDTHALLWLLAGDERIPDWLRDAGAGTKGQLLASDVSIWEIAIKSSLGRLDVPDDLPSVIESAGFGQLAINREHVWAVRDLEPKHGDPFDRLLVVQALVEDITLATSDRELGGYGISIRW